MSAYKVLTGESCFTWEYVRRLLKGYHSYCQVVGNVNSVFGIMEGNFFYSEGRSDDDMLRLR